MYAVPEERDALREKVTRDIASRLALLAKSFEADGHEPQVIAGFLQRSLFTMFAEDVGLLPEHGFKTLLDRAKENPLGFPVLVSGLKKIHDDLDAAVLEAYGWTDLATATTPPADLLAQGGPTAEVLEQQFLTRLVSLNHERAAEEQRGHIRYLRPGYQAPGAAISVKSINILTCTA